MTRDKLICSAIAVVLAVVIALSGIACLTSAFDLEPDDWTHIVCMTVFIALVSALCLYFPMGEIGLTALLMLSFYVAIRYGDLPIALEKLLNHVTTYYDKAYGCGVMGWSGRNLHRVDPDDALIALAALPAMAVCWVVQKRQWFGFAVLAALPPLALCCVVTDTLPDNTWLWLLLTALLLLTMTQRLRRITHRDANRLTALLLVPVVLFTGVIFRYTSEETYLDQAQTLQQELLDAVLDIADGRLDFLVNNQGGEGGEGNYAGPIGPGIPGSNLSVSDYLDLSKLGDIAPGEDAAITIQTNEYTGVLYLRGQAFDHYTGTRWESTEETGERGWPNGDFIRQGQITIKTEVPLPLQYFPYYISIPNWEDALYNGYYPNSNEKTEYTFNIVIPGQRPRPSHMTDEVLETYLELSGSTRTDARDILKENGINTNLQTEALAEAIADFVQNSAAYTHEPEQMPDGEEDFAIWFLAQSDSGYCVHFATATTVLLRAAGIPARYVTGYMTNVTAGLESVVTSGQAHAWVEYFHPDQGWTLLESTPVDPDDPIVTPPTTQPTQPTESTRPTRPTIPTQPTETTEPTVPTETTEPTFPSGDTTPTETTEPTASSGSTIPSETRPVAPVPTGPGSPAASGSPLNLKWIRGILWVLGIWLLIAAQYWLRVWLRNRKMHRGSPNRQAINRWRYVRRMARLSGHSAQSIVPVVEKAAFSQHELTEEELARFDEWFRQANQALTKKPWLLQFFLRLIFAVK